MRLLLDTHVLLWWLADDRALPDQHRQQIAQPENLIFVSAITLAEISIKHSIGKLDLPEAFDDAVARSGFQELAFTSEHARRLRALPWHHRDPFDRMLLAQAQADGLVFDTADPRCSAYGVPIL